MLRTTPDTVEAEVLTVDTYGNVQLAAPGSTVDGWPARILVDGRPAGLGRTFADADPGAPVVFVDSAGQLAVAVNGASAAAALHLSPGDLVQLRPAR